MMAAVKGHGYHLTLQEILDRVAVNVSQLRNEKKLSVEIAAARGKIHSRHWQKIESGESNPTTWTLVRIANALQIDLSELFGREPIHVKAEPRSKRDRRIARRSRARAARG
jgi:transcriptional regulator with XRE-family HTH domain